MNVVNKNPIVMIEAAWKRANRLPTPNGPSTTPVSPSTSSSSINYTRLPNNQQGLSDKEIEMTTQLASLDLASVCVSNILLIEDRYIPTPILKIYETCLTNQHDQQSKDILNLCMYIFKNWHDARTNLNFVRDGARVLGALSKRFIGAHLNVAIEATEINQKHILMEVMRKLKREKMRSGLSLIDFLRSFNKRSKYTDFDFELFDKDDADEYDNESRWFSTARSLIDNPIGIYSKRVIIQILKNYCTFILEMAPSMSQRLFDESVPSWLDEDSQKQGFCFEENNEKKTLRANIRNILLRTKKPQKNDDNKNVDDISREVAFGTCEDGDTGHKNENSLAEFGLNEETVSTVNEDTVNTNIWLDQNQNSRQKEPHLDENHTEKVIDKTDNVEVLSSPEKENKDEYDSKADIFRENNKTNMAMEKQLVKMLKNTFTEDLDSEQIDKMKECDGDDFGVNIDGGDGDNSVEMEEKILQNDLNEIENKFEEYSKIDIERLKELESMKNSNISDNNNNKSSDSEELNNTEDCCDDYQL